jgi:hypothetical protein
MLTNVPPHTPFPELGFTTLRHQAGMLDQAKLVIKNAGRGRRRS